ncbi:hypothetical protein SAMN05216257_103383 [Meinhardsimonia xiamenensis]|uniref:Gamma-glutamyl kinase n=1 Tax=Meinhardsimonia xiamenensis TaxID=990712 RepID=A0A1G9D839_9RHOB|nr:gamma-glutamyl kinase [Meinhardsimonia xiamenensis]PRX38096.1 hypothetical protein LV81_00371 [Meinhardsimonia xiamenensis]SDK60031.1 hypothetical protein SAMN05216257_103383 [Meinhardsimonia xiamenensis]
MLVFWEERLVFFATPKTGSTALEMALRPVAGIALTDPPVIKHTPAYRFRRFLAPYFAACGADDFETVAVVRHPVDWLGSWYRYRSRAELEGHPNSTRGMSFNDFVRAYLKRRRPPFAEVGSQAKFLTDSDGRIAVDHLFRYEALPALLTFLEKRLNREIRLKRLNESPAAELTLRPRLIARLQAERAEEFQVWEQARSG